MSDRCDCRIQLVSTDSHRNLALNGKARTGTYIPCIIEALATTGHYYADMQVQRILRDQRKLYFRSPTPVWYGGHLKIYWWIFNPCLLVQGYMYLQVSVGDLPCSYFLALILIANRA